MPFIILFSLWNVEYATPVLNGAGTIALPLALDTSGNPYILYEDNSYIRLLSKINGIWKEETIAIGASYIDFNWVDLEIDKYNRIWTLFKKYNEAESTWYVIVAHKDSSGWKYDTINSHHRSQGMYPVNFSFASDNYGFVHLTCDSAGDCITSWATGCYRIYNGYFWSNSEVIINDASPAYNSSMDLDSKGFPYISYEALDTFNTCYIKCARKNGEIWEIAVVDTYYTPSWSPTSIRINPKNDLPSIFYYHYNCDCLKYAWYDGNEWHKEIVDICGGTSENSALEFDSTGKPYVFYKQWDGEQIRAYIAYREKDGWHKEVLPALEPPFAHMYTRTIRIDKNGIFHMSVDVEDTNYEHWRIEHIYGYPSGIGEDKERHFKLDVNMNIVNSMLDIHFSIPEGQKVSLKLYNILGEKVMNVFQGYMKKDEYNFHIDLSRIKDGIYFLMLDGEKEGICKKIVIMR